MEEKPKISRYLISFIVLLFLFLSAAVYFILTSEEVANYLVNALGSNLASEGKLSLDIGEIQGCLLEGIGLDRISIRHIKPNFELRIKNLSLRPNYADILNEGSIKIVGKIDSMNCTGTLKLPEKLSSIPAFLGAECFAALPANIKIKNFEIKEINYLPCSDSLLEIYSSGFKLNEIENSDKLDVATDLRVVWKENLLGKAVFNGNFEQIKNKLNGKLDIRVANQVIETELNVASSRKGTDVSGYIASQTVIDLQPLSKWLGCLWQSEYPYGFSGKLYCQGSWFYSSELGFLGNLSGKYESLKVSLIGLLSELMELKGDWSFFDGNLNLKDRGSSILGFSASLNGKIDGVVKTTRKYDLVIDCNSWLLDRVTNSLPWVLKYSNEIPDLMGVATLSASIIGNRPMINAKVELQDIIQVSDKDRNVKISGKAFYILPEVGSGTINANFNALAAKGLPPFFKRFSNSMYAVENRKNVPTQYSFSVKGAFDGKIKLRGELLASGTEIFETRGDLIDNKFYLRAFGKENRVYDLNGANPIDLFLMR